MGLVEYLAGATDGRRFGVGLLPTAGEVTDIAGCAAVVAVIPILANRSSLGILATHKQSMAA
jgi:hypothetical protein